MRLKNNVCGNNVFRILPLCGLFLFFTLLNTSCENNKKSPNADPAVLTQSDSKPNRTDSLSLIAWGDTRFGMTKQEVMNSTAFEYKEKKNYDSEIVENGISFLDMDSKKIKKIAEIYDLQYLAGISAIFHQNELCEIYMYCRGKRASYLNDILNDCRIIIREFENKYNVSARYNNSASIASFKGRDSQIEIASIKIGTKEIKANLKQSEGLYYSYVINISNSSFPQKKYTPSDEEVERNKKENSIRNEIKESSF